MEEAEAKLRVTERIKRDSDARVTAEEMHNLEQENTKLKKYVMLLKRQNTKKAEDYNRELSLLMKNLSIAQNHGIQLEGTNQLLRDQVENTFGKVNTLEIVSRIINVLICFLITDGFNERKYDQT